MTGVQTCALPIYWTYERVLEIFPRLAERRHHGGGQHGRHAAGERPSTRRRRARGLKLAVLRHPMPYGDLVRQRVQRLATLRDLDEAEQARMRDEATGLVQASVVGIYRYWYRRGRAEHG